MCWSPAHRGCAPNEYADAAAVAHLQTDEVEQVLGRVSKYVVSRPVVYERWEGERWAMADRRAYAECRRRASGYARREIEKAVELLTNLQKHSEAVGPEYRHQWRHGDVVVWDNAQVQHRAVPHPFPAPKQGIHAIRL